ncbi:DUF6907 domain-containing protein [Streptomyces nigra]|uniref:DUF6907 domain-containing protein n=1 Tax=Streptomyces nigra TaxID=1827580 RepID=UPI0036BACEA3
MNHTVSGVDWPVDQPVPFVVTPLAERLDGIPAPRTACPSWCRVPAGRTPHICSGSEVSIPLGDTAALGAQLVDVDGALVLAVFSDDATGVDLDVDGVDALIEDVEAFLPKLRAMRDQLAAARAGSQNRSEPDLPECARCGNRRGPWKPTGERYPSGAQVLVCADDCEPSNADRCAAAHADDPAPCDGPAVVTVLDRSNGGAAGCEVHAARLLASLEGGRVYPLPDAPPGAAIRVFKAAGALRPFPWLEGGQ